MRLLREEGVSVISMTEFENKLMRSYKMYKNIHLKDKVPILVKTEEFANLLHELCDYVSDLEKRNNNDS